MNVLMGFVVVVAISCHGLFVPVGNDPANPPTQPIPNGRMTTGGLGSPDWFRNRATGNIYWGLSPDRYPNGEPDNWFPPLSSPYGR